MIHYRDGQALGQVSFPKNLPAFLGPTEFGNWGARGEHPDNAWTKSQAEHLKTRNLVGRIDELAILSRAMDAAEIKADYEAGKPCVQAQIQSLDFQSELRNFRERSFSRGVTVLDYKGI